MKKNLLMMKDLFGINLSAITDFSSLCVEYISIAFLSNHNFIDLF